VFSKETMPLLSTYKDFAKPDFYQGPKYNFYKESAIGVNKHIRKQQEEAAQRAFDYIQDLPTSPDARSASTDPTIVAAANVYSPSAEN
jgi:hypothetical protein